ncbi:hypothetical protein F4821DRAFT_173080 [Hypoxylon rubiginosum]|uniref:Uncharacterized protein n=1 Tax=Hypoxylon rubiginosum TaxID=110542 RepID=A0ACC0DGE8_9PEZI|nr:hypothetical protein F4821DRAFT_173080 [Hypoxylon rubiginosum]
MKVIVAAIALATILGAASAKTNQYASWDDCHNDKNRINTSGQDVILKSSTNTVFTTENFHSYTQSNSIGCVGESLGSFPKGNCNGTSDAFPGSKVTCLKLLVK